MRCERTYKGIKAQIEGWRNRFEGVRERSLCSFHSKVWTASAFSNWLMGGEKVKMGHGLVRV
jgi:hypothetical protein